MRAGFYECDITPPLGGFMWGHYRFIQAAEVFEKLYAKAVVIENDGSYAAIVVVDTCVVPREMHDAVTKRVEQFTGITPDKVCIASNHAHSGAPVSDGPEVGGYADVNYTDVFYRLTADAIILAYQRLEEVELSFDEPLIAGISYCRDHELNDGTLITHGGDRIDVIRHLSEPDRVFPILYFKASDRVIGTISCFACHQDTIGSTHPVKGYSGDYSSVISMELKEHYGDDFVNVFLIGCAGDINTANPNANAKAYNYIDIGKELAKVIRTREKYAKTVTASDVRTVKETITLERRIIHDQAEANRKMSAMLLEKQNPLRVRNMIYYMAANTEYTTDLYVQGILIGDVYFSLLPGEIFTNTGKRIKAESPFGRTVVAENCNSYCGYLPPEELFTDKCNLYETSLAFHSCHKPESATILADKAIEISRKL